MSLLPAAITRAERELIWTPVLGYRALGSVTINLPSPVVDRDGHVVRVILTTTGDFPDTLAASFVTLDRLGKPRHTMTPGDRNVATRLEALALVATTLADPAVDRIARTALGISNAVPPTLDALLDALVERIRLEPSVTVSPW